MRTSVPSVRTFVFIFALLFTTSTFSQSILFGGRNEIGLAFGPSFFLGDVGGNKGRDISDDRAGGLKHLNIPLTKFAKGAFIAVYPNDWLGFRLGINHTTLEGDDAVIPDGNGDQWFRKKRNLSFRSSALEGHLLAEIYPLSFLESTEPQVGLHPYLIAGFGATKVNPKTQTSTGEWVELRPLMLEGHGMAEFPNRKKYGSIVPSLNAGVGFKFYFGANKYKFAGFEVLHRSSKGAGADMIDGVSTTYIDPILFDKYLTPAQARLASQLYFREDELRNTRPSPAPGEQRGDHGAGGKEKDSWFTSIIRFGWVLPDPNSPEGRQARQMRCPTFY